MPRSLRKRITKADCLVQALRIIDSEPAAAGALKVCAGTTQGVVVFERRSLIGAAVHGSGERGHAALERLAGLEKAAVRYVKFYEKFIPGDQRIDVPLEGWIKKIVSRAEPIDSVPTSLPVGGCDEQSYEQMDSYLQRQGLHLSGALVKGLTEAAARLGEQQTQKASGDNRQSLQTSEPEAAQPEPSGARRIAADRWFKRKAQTKTWTHLIDRALFITVLALMVAGVIVVPAHIKKIATENARKTARQKLHRVIHDDLRGDQLLESQELKSSHPLRSARLGLVAGRLTIVRPEDMITGSANLSFARRLVMKGKLQAAIPYYEAHLRWDKRSIPARIELIGLYIKTGHRLESRKLCLQTLKMAPNSDQLSRIWQLFGRCQTG